MCGIAGTYRYASDRPIEGAVLREMVRRLRHRGPDDEGTFVSGRVALGHTRLSIIDLSPLGHQPFRDETGRFTLVYNGEIYNYKELRADLQAKGHRFRSQTDTEVVLRAYIEYGPSCVERLIGMFAFALWDEVAKVLFLARDRMGEKPLVYSQMNGSIVFASEINSLLADPDVSRAPDEIGLAGYLATGMYVPYPRTAYRQIQKLPPAHTLTIGPDGAILKRYWMPDFSRKTDDSLEESVARLDDVLGVTVESMMMSDVPIGLLLSGGIDSGSIAFKMRACSDRMRTFACGASETDEEFMRARAVAARLGTQHDEHIFSLRPETILRTVERFGEPIAEPSIVYRMQMCEFLKSRGMTVILTGDGGDEVFGGYGSYSLLRRYPWAKRILARLFGGRSPLRSLPGVERQLMPRVEAHRSPVPAALGDAYARKMRGNLRRLGCSRPAADEAVGEIRGGLVEWLAGAQVTDLVDGAMFADLMVCLHHNHVMIPDCVGMSQSLELRSPFLDVRLVEFATSLPSAHKVSREPLLNKTVLRRLLERRLPPALVYAAKIGYGGNIRYLETHETTWSSVCGQLAHSGLVSGTGLVGAAALSGMARPASTLSVYDHMSRFAVIMLGVWLDRSVGSGSFVQSLDDAFAARSRAV